MNQVIRVALPIDNNGVTIASDPSDYFKVAGDNGLYGRKRSEFVNLSPSVTSTFAAMSADYAIWSGYQLKQERFREFMEALIGDIALRPNLTLINLVAKYLNWKRDLSPNVREYAPGIRFRVSNPKGRDVTHMFFTIRSIDYKDPCQLEDPANGDYKKASTQTAEDKGKLEKWLNYVNANKKREEPVGPDMFDFSFMKDRYETKLDQ